MYIRAKADAFLDPSAQQLDTLSAEPLRTWRVTGSDAAVEAFRVAVGGVVVPDEDVVAVQDAAVVAVQVVEATKKVEGLQVDLDTATVELTRVKKKLADITTPVVVDPVPVVDDTAPAEVVTPV
jgi:hypothetical protein